MQRRPSVCQNSGAARVTSRLLLVVAALMNAVWHAVGAAAFPDDVKQLTAQHLSLCRYSDCR
jgi:hypothetical protein